MVGGSPAARAAPSGSISPPVLVLEAGAADDGTATQSSPSRTTNRAEAARFTLSPYPRTGVASRHGAVRDGRGLPVRAVRAEPGRGGAAARHDPGGAPGCRGEDQLRHPRLLRR